MASVTVGVVREGADGERRVALVPADVAALRADGVSVVVQSGAGVGAWFCDEAYALAGAEVVTAADVYARADVVLCVRPPAPDEVSCPHPGQVVLGLIGLRGDAAARDWLAARGVTAVSFDGLPRTVSRAQSMDALTSQASVAGYKAVLVAADAFGGILPMLITAAGTSRPARVLVLGAGVAGLQAIGTARRLGAVVRAFDVRPASRDEVASLGAAFVELGRDFGGSGSDGYARALTGEEQRALPELLVAHVAKADIVITTAQVPGRTPPILVTEAAVKALAAGSVIVDLAAGAHGGNVACARAGQTLVTENGVTVIGADNLPASVPAAASTAYSHNVSALLRHLIRDGRVVFDPADEIQSGVVVIRDGRIIQPPTKGE